MNEVQKQMQRERHSQQETFWQSMTQLEQHEYVGKMYFDYHGDPERELTNMFYSSDEHLDESDVPDTLTSLNCATEDELELIS